MKFVALVTPAITLHLSWVCLLYPFTRRNTANLYLVLVKRIYIVQFEMK
jgi:hypothetical protein